jgi:hypothetical protein
MKSTNIFLFYTSYLSLTWIFPIEIIGIPVYWRLGIPKKWNFGHRYRSLATVSMKHVLYRPGWLARGKLQHVAPVPIYLSCTVLY